MDDWQTVWSTRSTRGMSVANQSGKRVREPYVSVKLVSNGGMRGRTVEDELRFTRRFAQLLDAALELARGADFTITLQPWDEDFSIDSKDYGGPNVRGLSLRDLIVGAQVLITFAQLEDFRSDLRRAIYGRSA